MNSENKHLIDYLALIVAFIALLGGIYSAYLTRIHNRLSVTPHLVIEEYGPHIGYRAGTTHEFRLNIKNNGVGPAAIEKIAYASTLVDSDDILQISRSLGIPRQGYVIWNLHKFPTYLGAGESIKLLQIDTQGLSNLDASERANRLNKLSEAILKIEITVPYRSLYQEKKLLVWKPKQRPNE